MSDSKATRADIVAELKALRARADALEDQLSRMTSEDVPVVPFPIRRSLIHEIPNFITVVDRDFKILFVNHTVRGLNEDQVVGRLVFEFVTPDFHDLVAEKIFEVFETGEPTGYVSSAFGPDGTITWYENHVGLINAGQKDEAVVLVGTDISERLRAESALKESEKSLKTAQRLQDVGIWEWDLRDDTFTMSEQMCRIYGLERDKLVDDLRAVIDAAIHPADREHVKRMAQRVHERRSGDELTYRIVTRTGEVRWLSSTAPAVMRVGENGDPEIMVGAVQDITDRKNLEEQLLQSQKLDAIGTLAAGVAHEMNNILTMILMLSSLLKNNADESDLAYSQAAEIISACERGRSLTSNLLGFGRKAQYHKTVCSLNRSACDAARILQPTISKKIRVILHLVDDLAKVDADPNQLAQVLMSICLNAADAMKGGGDLEISTANVELCDDRIAGLKPGRYVELRVIDNGVGMDEETVQRAFEPFFTTKNVGEGTGLGLSVAYGIITNHNGAITIDSKIGVGTTVTVYLPAYDNAEAVECRADVELRSERKTGTVLLVDDEETIRLSGQLVLEDRGYRVLTAESGRRALALYRDNRSIIDLVVLDAMMASMDGEECLARLRQIDPDVRVIVCSGLAIEATVNAFCRQGAVAFLGKPFDPSQLVAAIESAMPEAT